MKKIQTLLAIFLCIHGYSQSGNISAIDLGLDFGMGNCVVEYNPDTIVVLSRCFDDSLGWERDKLCFSIHDSDGKLLRTDTCSDSIYMHNDLHNSLYALNNKIIGYCKGYDLKEYWLEYDVVSGNILCIYDNLFSEDLVISCSGFIQLSQSRFAAIYNDFNVPFDFGIGIFQDFELVEFINIYPPKIGRLVSLDISSTTENTLIVGGVIQLDEPGLILRKPFFEEYSLDGDLLWKYDLPPEYDNYHVYSVLPLEDPDEFVCTFYYSSYVFPDGGEHRVMKISKSDGVVWDIPFGYRKEQGSTNHTLPNILMSPDNDGYILSGSVYDHDSLWHKRAIIGKISEEGDSLWMRSYAITSTYNSSNFINDLTYSSDGGFIGVGGHVYGTVSEVPDGEDLRRLLFIKTDKDGYISPPSDTEELLSTDFSVSIFPNPVSDILTLYQAEPEQLHYQIVDESGRLLHAFENSYASHYTLHDVSSYPEGTYYLLINDEAGSVESMGFVVCH